MKQRHILFFCLAGVILLFISFQSAPTGPTETSSQPENVILLIGDGMGPAQVSYLYYFGENPIHFSRFSHVGMHITVPADERITDSAAAGTAIASGSKTFNGTIGINPQGDSLTNLLEMAFKKGKRTGLVATSSITDATPAAFFAKVQSRSEEENIAAQFIQAPVDFAAAGGYQFFTQRQDRRNLLDSLRAKGTIVDTTGLPSSGLDLSRRYVFLLGPDSLLHVVEKEGRGRGSFLPDATRLAINYLSEGENGFFLMVEGSQIDWGCHQKDTTLVLEELMDFNRAVGVALDFAEKNGRTLVVVTGDHETGGLALIAEATLNETTGKTDYNKKRIVPKFSTGEHTASLIPVFAYGPGAERFSGIYQNNELFEKLKW